MYQLYFSVILHIFLLFPSPSDTPSQSHPVAIRRPIVLVGLPLLSIPNRRWGMAKRNMYRIKERQRKRYLLRAGRTRPPLLPLTFLRRGCSAVLKEHSDRRRPRVLPPTRPADAFLHVLLWGSQVLHLTKRLRRVCLSPLPYHRDSFVWILFIPSAGWPRARCSQKGAGSTFRLTPLARF